MIYDFAELYDAQYAFYRDDLVFYTRLAEDYGSPILELGCGTGRVTAALAKAGYEVVGLERAEAMLGKARERLAGYSGIRLELADMRSFDLAQVFPLIIAPFNTFMHLYTLQDQDATLACIQRHLAPGGLVALDLYNPNFANLETLKRVAEWEHVGGSNAELFVYQSQDVDAQVLESRYYLDTVLADGSLKRRTATLTQRYYTRFELERALYQAGFSQVQIFGGFDKRRYSVAAPQLIALARC